MQLKIDIGKPWTTKQHIEFHTINYKFLLLKIWQKLKFLIWSKTFNKLDNQPKNKRKFRSLWDKLTNFGNQDNLTLQVGEKGKMLSSLVYVSKILLRDYKKIKWLYLQLMHKDTSFPLKKELSSWLEGSQILHKH
jgi:hypothetical protein